MRDLRQEIYDIRRGEGYSVGDFKNKLKSNSKLGDKALDLTFKGGLGLSYLVNSVSLLDEESSKSLFESLRDGYFLLVPSALAGFVSHKNGVEMNNANKLMFLEFLKNYTLLENLDCSTVSDLPATLSAFAVGSLLTSYPSHLGALAEQEYKKSALYSIQRDYGAQITSEMISELNILKNNKKVENLIGFTKGPRALVGNLMSFPLKLNNFNNLNNLKNLYSFQAFEDRFNSINGISKKDSSILEESLR